MLDLAQQRAEQVRFGAILALDAESGAVDSQIVGVKVHRAHGVRLRLTDDSGSGRVTVRVGGVKSTLEIVEDRVETGAGRHDLPRPLQLGIRPHRV